MYCLHDYIFYFMLRCWAANVDLWKLKACILFEDSIHLVKKTAMIILALFHMCNIKYDSEKSHFYFNGEMQKTASKVSIVTSKHPLNNTDVPAGSHQ